MYKKVQLYIKTITKVVDPFKDGKATRKSLTRARRSKTEDEH
jgi:hypothetical protein